MSLARIYGLFFWRDSLPDSVVHIFGAPHVLLLIKSLNQAGTFQSGMWQASRSSLASLRRRRNITIKALLEIKCCAVERCWLLYHSSIQHQHLDLRGGTSKANCFHPAAAETSRLTTRGHPQLWETRRWLKAKDLLQTNNVTSTACHPSFEGDVHFLHSWAVEANGALVLIHTEKDREK